MYLMPLTCTLKKGLRWQILHYVCFITIFKIGKGKSHTYVLEKIYKNRNTKTVSSSSRTKTFRCIHFPKIDYLF